MTAPNEYEVISAAGNHVTIPEVDGLKDIYVKE
eukprot:CAMPEP_0201574964 /NCGR_PEP_ID=MMETSP0190_2-20130828/19819_1 /ASSEMBLY_ACC=CAM_ASM_000263 /TAXON_ID=37353 /ORGANISM="Rosalina sp." /LENGTH=32 /DNA_ID= /DNA_START= /DNA_END= /DNA_ORIENTATION=